MQRTKESRDRLNIPEPTRKVWAGRWRRKIESQIPKRQILRPRACLSAVSPIDHPCSVAEPPTAAVDERGKAGLQVGGYFLDVRPIHVGIESVQRHDVLTQVTEL